MLDRRQCGRENGKIAKRRPWEKKKVSSKLIRRQYRAEGGGKKETVKKTGWGTPGSTKDFYDLGKLGKEKGEREEHTGGTQKWGFTRRKR